MSEKPPSKDEALEALDFIVNVLKEHEKDLDRLVSELGSVAGQLGESGELNEKVKKIEDKINNLQSEVGGLVKSFSAQANQSSSVVLNAVEKPKITLSAAPHVQTSTAQMNVTNLTSVPSSMPLMLQCSRWEDFLELSMQANTVSFEFKESEKTLQISAIKNNQIITFSGQIPDYSMLLKIWLSKQLEVPEKRILEGNIALR